MVSLTEVPILEEEMHFLPLTTALPLARLQPALPTTGVIGEVKPYTRRGLDDGLRQLRLRRPASARKVIVAYRPVGRRLQVMLADVSKVLRRTDPLSSLQREPWYHLGVIDVDLERTIPIRTCPSYVGNLVESQIRAVYARAVGLPYLPKKSSSATGADIVHERGLAGELGGGPLGVATVADRLRAELAHRFTNPNDPRLAIRRRRLRALFAQIAPAEAAGFVARLGDRPTADPLSRLFHGRLATATRRELLAILRARIPAVSAPPPPPALPSLTFPDDPLPANASARFAIAAADLRARVVATPDPRRARLLCILNKLGSGVDDRVIQWHRICPRTSGALGAAYIVGPCDITAGQAVDQATLQSAIHSIGDVEAADARLAITTHLRPDILLTYDVSPAADRLDTFVKVHDDVQRALGNLDKWANVGIGGNSAMPTAYRSLAGWIQLQRDDPRTVFSCF